MGVRILLTIWIFGVAAGAAHAQRSETLAPPSETLPNDPIRIETGLISGGLVEPQAGVRAYLGIPYAARPIGALRWRAPQPPASWEGVRPCYGTAPACLQPDPVDSAPIEMKSEDCLFVNVWTPARGPNDELPVMVWIHGGGFTTGHGGATYLDGTYLAAQGVVIVTINYRLGPMGFFAHPMLSRESDHGVSGNYGLLDQIAALQWVRRNIVVFGGDPGRVTIFGESAGGRSVSLLMISPLAKGLFHRAIVQSGAIRGPTRRLRGKTRGLESMETIGTRFGAGLGLRPPLGSVDVLRSKRPSQIFRAMQPDPGFFNDGFRWGPVVDGWAIPDDPAELYAQGKQHDAPMIVGSNADEATTFLRNPPATDSAGYERWARGRYGDHAARVLELYPIADGAAVTGVGGVLNRLLTDARFIAPARSQVRAMAGVRSKAFLYHFTRVPPNPFGQSLGAYHASEIPYVFGNFRAEYAIEETDVRLVRAMSRYWTQFAATGDPNIEGQAPWPEYESESDQYLELGAEIAARKDLRSQGADLFDAIEEARRASGDE